jgi:hypothetical protein
LDEVLGLGHQTGLIRRFKFDNVSLAFYPKVILPETALIDPPETLTYDEEISPYIESELQKDVVLGDMIRFDTTTLRNEANLYRGYFRLSDGTPTRIWARAGVAEAKNLLQITLEDYVAQFSEPQKKLSGSMVTNQVIHFINCIRDNIDNSVYRPMTFVFDGKQAMYTIDMSATVDGTEPEVEGAFENDAFTAGFEIG